MYRRYYSPFDEAQPARKEYEAELIKPQKIEQIEQKEEKIEKCEEKKKSQGFDFFNRISNDDIILIGILILLLMEDKENRDIPLVLGIAFLLLIEYIEKD